MNANCKVLSPNGSMVFWFNALIHISESRRFNPFHHSFLKCCFFIYTVNRDDFDLCGDFGQTFFFIKEIDSDKKES